MLVAERQIVALPPSGVRSNARSPQHVLAPMVRKLDVCEPLDEADRQAILALPFTLSSRPGRPISGLGRRQAAEYLPADFRVSPTATSWPATAAARSFRSTCSGDIVDLQNSLLGTADHNVQMLTAGEIVMIPVEAMRELAFDHPSVGMAMWYETLVEGSIFREWVLNIGRRDASTRIAHLLCEFALQMEMAELGEQINYELPISQEQLADAVALTSVHVNRTLMKLEGDGLITRNRRMITVGRLDKADRRGRFRAALSPHWRTRRPGPGGSGGRQVRVAAARSCGGTSAWGSPARTM